MKSKYYQSAMLSCRLKFHAIFSWGSSIQNQKAEMFESPIIKHRECVSKHCV